MAGASGGVGLVAGVSLDRLAELVARSCAASGVPVKVTDPGVVRQVVSLLGGPVGSGPARRRSQRRSSRRLPYTIQTG